jgi:DNA-binding NtrC family response regulator
MTIPRVLLVEPDPDLRERLRLGAGKVVQLDSHSDFRRARASLLSNPYDWVVTNIRLAAYNGLQLLHVATALQHPARFLMYADEQDAPLAREAQLTGAFFELRRGVHRVLPAYLRGAVPAHDRRNASQSDRRRAMRSGRRASDMASAVGLETAELRVPRWLQ